MKLKKLAATYCALALCQWSFAQTANDPSVQYDNTVTAPQGQTGVIVGGGYTQDTSGGEQSVADGWRVDYSSDIALVASVTPEVFSGGSWVACTSSPPIFFSGQQSFACSQSGGVIIISLENGALTALTSQNIGEFFRLNVDLAATAPQGSQIDFIITNHRPASGAEDMADGTFGAANQNGLITVEGPALTFNPVAGVSVDTGSVAVGGTTSGGSIIVTESGTAGSNVRLQSCSLSGQTGGAFNLNYTGGAFPDTFTGGMGRDETLSVTCDPAGVAASATLSCEVQDAADNSVIASPSWPLTCEGLVPNVGIDDGDGLPPVELNLTANVGGPAGTGNVSVFNTGGADANMAVLNRTSTDTTEIGGSIALTDSTIAAGTSPSSPDDTLTFSCSSATTANVTETFNITYDDLGSGNSPTATITVNCLVTDTAPMYNSTPIAPNGTFGFGAVANGESSSLSVDVFNDNDIGTPFSITSVTPTGSAVYSVDAFNPGPYNGVAAPDGGNDITVSCTPNAVGIFPMGNLEVVTDTAGTHNYDLTCEGTGDLLTIAPAGGSLNLGSVPPNTDAGPRTFTLTNNSLSETLSISCTETDAGDVFTFNPVPNVTDIPPGGSLEISVIATPTAIEPFTATLDCTEGGAQVAAFALNASVSGRPLVIPALSQWGLLLLMLSLLVAGGFAARRMTA